MPGVVCSCRSGLNHDAEDTSHASAVTTSSTPGTRSRWKRSERSLNRTFFRGNERGGQGRTSNGLHQVDVAHRLVRSGFRRADLGCTS